MTTMQDLINAHRRAYAAFIMIINEQNRLGGEEEVSRECEVDILLARIPSGRDLIIPDCASPASVYGTDKEDLLQQVETIYKDHASRLFWLERHSKDLYDTATNLLDDLHIKNLSFVAPAFEAWQKNRNAIAKKKTDLEKNGRKPMLLRQLPSSRCFAIMELTTKKKPSERHTFVRRISSITLQITPMPC